MDYIGMFQLGANVYKSLKAHKAFYQVLKNAREPLFALFVGGIAGAAFEDVADTLMEKFEEKCDGGN